MTSRGSEEATLRVSEKSEAIEVMTSNHATSPRRGGERDIWTVLLTLVSVVGSGRVSTFFACTESQESNSGIGLCNGTRHCALGPFLKHEFLTLDSLVQSESVIPIFDSAEPQEFNSDIGLHNRTRQCALGPIFRPDFLTLVPVGSNFIKLTW